MSIVARCLAATAAIVLFGISCTSDHTPPSGPQVQPASERAATLAILPGTSTSAIAGDTLRVRALVTDSAGRPVPNATVYFVLDPKDPAAFAAVSDSTGVATRLLKAPIIARDYVAEASLLRMLPNGTATALTARFDVHVRGGIATRAMHPVTTQQLVAYQGATVTTPEYTAYDQFGNLATSGVVTFRSVPDGSIASTQAPDSLGRVKSQPWTLGTTMGTYRLIASVQEFPDTLSAVVASGPPARIEAVTTPLVVGAGHAPIRKPAVIVRDAEGRVVPSADVTWSDSTGVLAGCASKTRTDGVAQIGCDWVAGSADGDYRLIASTGALSTTIAVNVLAKPATFEIVSGPEPGSTIRVGSAVDITLRLRLANGEPAVGYAINGSSPITTVTTDASGIARYHWVLAPYVLPQTMTVVVDAFPELTRSIAVRTVGEPGYFDISAGGAHTCASTGIGSLSYTNPAVVCWGGNAQGQLGNGTTVSRTVPTAATLVPAGTSIYGVSGYFDVVAGAAHTCVARSSYPISAYEAAFPYSLLCWGGNASGQSGAAPSTSIGATEMGTALTAPAAGATHGCAMQTRPATSGRYSYYETTGVQCWGDNTFGELGDGTTSSRFRPADVVSPALERTSHVSAGDGFTCALNAAGEAYCWGKNSDGQLGDGTTIDRHTPVPVAGGLHFAAISAGTAHACGMVSSGQIYCWGRNDMGQLGDGTSISRTAPAPVVGSPSLTTLAAGGAHTCGLTSSGSAFCWGDNRFGQLGNGTTANSVQAVAVSGGQSFRLITAGGSHTCAVPEYGVGAFCWGLNADGQLGDGTTTNRSTPTRVAEYLSPPPPAPSSAAARRRRP